MTLRKGALLRWMESRWLQRYLKGRGMEIGALWRRFPVPRSARVWYVDRMSDEGLSRHYPELRGGIVQPDLLADSRAHYADWVENVGGKDALAPEFEAEVRNLMEERYSVHFHVWTDEDVKKIVAFTRESWKLEWEPVLFWRARFYRKETTVLLVRK